MENPGCHNPLPRQRPRFPAGIPHSPAGRSRGRKERDPRRMPYNEAPDSAEHLYCCGARHGSTGHPPPREQKRCLHTADPSTGARGGTCSSSDPEPQPQGVKAALKPYIGHIDPAAIHSRKNGQVKSNAIVGRRNMGKIAAVSFGVGAPNAGKERSCDCMVWYPPISP